MKGDRKERPFLRPHSGWPPKQWQTNASVTLPVAFEEVFCECFEGDGTASERFQGGIGPGGETSGNSARFFEADDRWVSGLLGGNVFTGGLAELLAGLGNIQNIIYDLESEADVIAEIGKSPELCRGAVRGHAAKAHGTAKKRGSFSFVDISKVRFGDLFSLAFEIGHLTSDELEGAGRLGQIHDHLVMGVAFGGRGLNQYFEGLGEEGISGENGDAFPVNLVVRGFAPAEVVVIHGRQVVMDEGISVDAFDSAGSREGWSAITAARLGGGQTESGPQAFTPSEQGVTHGCMNCGRPCFRLGQKPVESGIHRSGGFLQIRIENERGAFFCNFGGAATN